MNFVWGVTSFVKGALGLEAVDPQDSFISEKRELAAQANELEDDTLMLQGKIARLREKVNQRRLQNLNPYRNPKVHHFERCIFCPQDVRFAKWDNLIGLATSKNGAARLARAQRRDVFVWFQCDYEDATKSGKVYGFTFDELSEEAAKPDNWISAHHVCSGIVYIDPDLFEEIPSMVVSVEARAGDRMDQICMWMASGECQVFGKHGGHEAEPFELQVDEFIMQVTGRRTDDHTSGIQFLTNKERLSPWYGRHRGHQFRFDAPPGNCVVGLEFVKDLRINGTFDVDVEDTVDAFECSKLAVRAESLIILTHGTKVILRAKATGNYMQCLEDLSLDGEGKGKGVIACEFLVHQITLQTIALESVMIPGRFLQLTKLAFDCGGKTLKEPSAIFTVVHHKNNEVSFINESGAAGIGFSGKAELTTVGQASGRFFCKAVQPIEKPV